MDIMMQALIYLTATVICVPISKRLGMGSVLGYLIAGMLIGPFFLGLIGKEGEDIMHFAEFGVVMMLFLIGLELEPSQFWKMRKSIVGMGSIQIVMTTLIVFFTMILAGMSWQVSLATGLAFSMSSTAIVLQTIKEKGLSQTASGQASFSVLLFQDIMVIPVLALLPLLALDSISDSSAIDSSVIGNLPGWLQGLSFFFAVAFIYLGGRYLFVPLLRLVAKTRLRELFTASALLLVIAVSALMQVMGLSPALGAFLAGVVLANSEYRHELESDIEPFKGLLLGLFFIGVGISINFGLIISKPLVISGLVLFVMIIKFIVLYITGRIFRISNDQNLLFSFALSQVGEFAFVLLSFSNQLRLINQEWVDIFMAVTAITMTITPLLLMINERIIDPRFGVKAAGGNQQPDKIDKKHAVIIAGFGQFGSTISRFLKANGVEATILDHDSDRVEFLRKLGFKVYYGDATRFDLLESAGAGDAKFLIAAIDPPETNLELIATVKKHFPHLRILARAKNRSDAYEIIDQGIRDIYMESQHTSLKLAEDLLNKLGHRRYTVSRLGQKFLKHDNEMIAEMAAHRHDMKKYVIKARETFRHEEELLRNNLYYDAGEGDHSWDSEQIRETLLKQ
ncbi:MAG: cation:proton antiporter [Bacteroidia bacterium]|nr:cation:proton antiporter [Bacteroidia bacterium]